MTSKQNDRYLGEPMEITKDNTHDPEGFQGLTTTEARLKKILEHESGMEAGKDFFPRGAVG